MIQMLQGQQQAMLGYWPDLCPDKRKTKFVMHLYLIVSYSTLIQQLLMLLFNTNKWFSRLSQSPSLDLDISSGSRTPSALGLFGLFLGVFSFSVFYHAITKNISESTCGKSSGLVICVINKILHLGQVKKLVSVLFSEILWLGGRFYFLKFFWLGSFEAKI